MRLSLSLFVLALLLRASVGLGPYSGQNTPPMRGDFEAQRHWMEITSNLPLKEWYVGRDPRNDLMYWGLDYPPMTAYHSWAFGELFKLVTPESVQLFESRGSETSETKTWMRFAVLVSDALTFIPAVIYFFGGSQQNAVEMLLALISPALVLIDHGHFQFNCVAHGLAVMAWSLLIYPAADGRRRTTKLNAFMASVLFCLSLNFKQMSLYYAPTMFFYLLGWAMTTKEDGIIRPLLPKFIRRLIVLGMAVLGTFGILWGPFLWNGTAFQVLQRVFPFERGIFEDKVANFWCTTNVVIKWRTVATKNALVMLSFAFTALTIAPSCLLATFKHRGGRELRWPLFTVALSFFLFSFQVHEKSILLPLVPAVLLFDEDFFTGFWFSIFANISLIPLFVKDQIVPTALLLTMMFALCALLLRPEEFTLMSNGGIKWPIIGAVSMLVALLSSSALILFATPPARLPDLFVVIHNGFSFVAFIAFWIYGNLKQLSTEESSPPSGKKDKTTTEMSPLALDEDNTTAARAKKKTT